MRTENDYTVTSEVGSDIGSEVTSEVTSKVTSDIDATREYLLSALHSR